MKHLFSKTLICVLLLTNVSCGPSEAEKRKIEETRVAHDDSVKRAAEDEVKQKYAEREKINNSLKQASDALEGGKNRLVALKANLAVANDQMNEIKKWQLGRSSSEREEQIRRQEMAIQNIENDIEATQENINRLQERLQELQTRMQSYQ